MKNILLLSIIIVSLLQATAQNTALKSDSQHQRSIQNNLLPFNHDVSGIPVSKNASYKNLILLSSTEALHRVTPIQILDSVYHWRWEPSIKEWTYNYRIKEFTYTDKNKLASAVQQEWNIMWWTWENSSKLEITYDLKNNPIRLTVWYWEDAWENDIQFLFTYDENNNEIAELYQEWDGMIWENVGLYSRTYDALQRVTSEASQYWGGSFWLNEYRNLYTYDNHNNLVRNLSQSGFGTSWMDASQYLNTYDGNNLLQVQVFQYWQDNAWQNVSQFTLAYDVNLDPISKLGQSWDSITWQNNSLNSYTYDLHHNLLRDVEQTWNGNAWGNSKQHLYAYDANQHQTLELAQKWDENKWLNEKQYTHAYDSDDFVVHETSRYFNVNGIDVQYGDSTYNYYYTATGTEDLIPSAIEIIIAPNPNSGTFSVISSFDVDRIEIYTLCGKRVYAPSFQSSPNTFEINLSGSPNGMYILVLGNAGRTYTRLIAVH